MKIPQIENRMVAELKEQVAEKTMQGGLTVKRKTKNIAYGVDTTSKSRALMFEMLPSIVDDEYDKIVSKYLYDDIAGLEHKRNGKIEHSDSSHDDVLMAYLLFRYAVVHGKCLRNKFGISSIPSSANAKTNGQMAESFKTMVSMVDYANKHDQVSSYSTLIDTNVLATLQARQNQGQDDNPYKTKTVSQIKSISKFNKD